MSVCKISDGHDSVKSIVDQMLVESLEIQVRPPYGIGTWHIMQNPALRTKIVISRVPIAVEQFTHRPDRTVTNRLLFWIAVESLEHT